MNLITLGTVCCVQTVWWKHKVKPTTSKCKNKTLSASFLLLLLVSWHRSKQQTHYESVIQNFGHCQNFIADCLWSPDHDCQHWTHLIEQQRTTLEGSPKTLLCFSDNGFFFNLSWEQLSGLIIQNRSNYIPCIHCLCVYPIACVCPSLALLPEIKCLRKGTRLVVSFKLWISLAVPGHKWLGQYGTCHIPIQNMHDKSR